ncbi:zinc-dependent metalloprotease [Aureivirga sp. CE67]|uniref:zinc-dependent metalloprotease n=1 Tax=Aureivirga sp. CE67 TaxID=1788983 RepID=UPI0018CB5109|nr:zinc-dependent metalloprotease [Aureivirga sp. CE67]
MKKKILFYSILVFCSYNVFSQEIERCASEAFMNEKMKNAEYQKEHQEIQELFQANLIQNKISRKTQNELYIPVAVHFPTGSETNRACLVELAQKQIEILNQDFNGANQDISNWQTVKNNYPNSNTGAVNVKFVLATKNHPNLDPELLENEPAVTIGYNFGDGGDNDLKWAGYLNFLVKPIGTGILGYSPVGGNPLNGDAIVMNVDAFGDNTVGCGEFTAGFPFDLGRTVTHELGHHFNLEHIWGNGCSIDDGIEDTPDAASPSSGCPGMIPECGSINMTMNFMDYTNDACMYMFSEGQTEVMRAYIESVISNYHNDRLDPYHTNSTQNRPEGFSFDIYPNPSLDFFNIEMISKSNTEEITIHLYDTRGRLVYNRKSSVYTNHKIQTDIFNKGFYIIKIFGGGNQFVGKILIAK